LTPRDALTSTKVGHELNRHSANGSLISESSAAGVTGYWNGVNADGAECCCAGVASVPGYEKRLLREAALGGPPITSVRWTRFWPEAYVMPSVIESEGREYGQSFQLWLANSVWTGDLARANRVAESMVAGNSWINAHISSRMESPIGGAT